jgi:hypothetical protein
LSEWRAAEREGKRVLAHDEGEAAISRDVDLFERPLRKGRPLVVRREIERAANGRLCPFAIVRNRVGIRQIDGIAELEPLEDLSVARRQVRLAQDDNGAELALGHLHEQRSRQAAGKCRTAHPGVAEEPRSGSVEIDREDVRPLREARLRQKRVYRALVRPGHADLGHGEPGAVNDMFANRPRDTGRQRDHERAPRDHPERRQDFSEPPPRRGGFFSGPSDPAGRLDRSVARNAPIRGHHAAPSAERAA